MKNATHDESQHREWLKAWIGHRVRHHVFAVMSLRAGGMSAWDKRYAKLSGQVGRLESVGRKNAVVDFGALGRWQVRLRMLSIVEGQDGGDA